MITGVPARRDATRTAGTHAVEAPSVRSQDVGGVAVLGAVAGPDVDLLAHRRPVLVGHALEGVDAAASGA